MYDANRGKAGLVIDASPLQIESNQNFIFGHQNKVGSNIVNTFIFGRSNEVPVNQTA